MQRDYGVLLAESKFRS